MHPSDYNCPFHGLFMVFSTQIIACCAYRCSYLRFSYPFRPRAESATFLFATMVNHKCRLNFMLTKRRFWKDEQKIKPDFEGSTF